MIRNIKIKNFPGVKDGIYNLSQDNLILGKSISGKTSFIKAIVYGFVGCGLDGEDIPNITDKTEVSITTIYGNIKNVGGRIVSGLPFSLFKGGPEIVLSRLIPGYIFNASIPNAKKIEILTGNSIEEFFKSHGESYVELYTLNKNYKNIKAKGMQYSGDVSRSFNSIYNKGIRLNNFILNKNEVKTLDESLTSLYSKSPQTIEEIKEYTKEVKQFLISNNINFTASHNISLGNLLIDIVSKIVGNSHCIKSLCDLSYEKYIAQVSKDYKNYNMDENIFYIHLFKSIKNFIRYLNDAIYITNTYYDKISQLNILNLNKSINRFNTIKNAYTNNVNENLENIGLSYNGRSIGCNIVDGDNTYDFYTLPKSIRYYTEITICANAQYNFLRGLGMRADEMQGLILIDDYPYEATEDNIDKVYQNCLSHQCIITKTDESQEDLKFIY